MFVKYLETSLETDHYVYNSFNLLKKLLLQVLVISNIYEVFGT